MEGFANIVLFSLKRSLELKFKKAEEEEQKKNPNPKEIF
jgi:hypothetical protein